MLIQIWKPISGSEYTGDMGNTRERSGMSLGCTQTLINVYLRSKFPMSTGPRTGYVPRILDIMWVRIHPNLVNLGG